MSRVLATFIQSERVDAVIIDRMTTTLVEDLDGNTHTEPWHDSKSIAEWCMPFYAVYYKQANGECHLMFDFPWQTEKTVAVGIAVELASSLAVPIHNMIRS